MKSHLKVLLIFVLISSSVIFAWFRDGKLYGGGDTGLQTYNPQRILENAKYMWWDSIGPGVPLPQALSAIPFQAVLYLFALLGFGPVALEAGLFFALLLLMGFGMYLFSSSVAGLNRKYAVGAGIFYVLNPYMMIQVWHRFIHTTMMLAAALPFLGLFWSKWVKFGQGRDIILFLITSALSVYVFGTYAFIITVWIFLFFLTIPLLFPIEGRKELLRIGLRFLFGFILWISINAWWLLPVSRISPASLSQQHQTEESIMTMITISAQEILPYSVTLINPFYLVYQNDFGQVYRNLFFKLIPWLFVFIILAGLFGSLRKKTFSFYGIFYLLSLFLAKGAAPPFGNIFIYGFSSFFVLGVLRNPFEKTGLMLVFFSALLFACGLKFLSEVLRNKLLNRFAYPFALILLFIFSWPMFFGKVIGRIDKPAFVEVPESYKQANIWLNSRKNAGIADGKILHLPLTGDESVQYNWEYGYNGLEPSDTFFTGYPSISRGFNMKRIDDTLKGLAQVFDGSMPKERILSYLAGFSVRFIVLHKDIDIQGRDLIDPLLIEKLLQSLDIFEEKQIFGDLAVYRLKDEYFKPKVSFEENFSMIYPGEENISFWPFLIKHPETQLVSTTEGKADDAPAKGESYVFPRISFVYGTASESAFPQMDYYLERLSALQPFFRQTGMIQSLDLTGKMTLLSKSLNDPDSYGKILEDVFPKAVNVNKLQVKGQESLLSAIFRLHMEALRHMEESNLGSEKEKIQMLRSKLEKNLIDFDLKPSLTQGSGERRILKFDIPKSGNYGIYMTNARTASLYPQNLDSVRFSLNGREQILQGLPFDNIINFGNFDFEQGELEIGLPLVLSENLASGQQLKGNPPYVEIPVKEVSGAGMYRFSADLLSPEGGIFYFMLLENNQVQPSMKEPFRLNPSGESQKLKINFETKTTAKSASVIIFPQQFSRVDLSGIAIQKILDDKIFLKSVRQEPVSNGGGDLNFTRRSPVEYGGKINIPKPGFLFFRETYHPGWKLQLWDKGGSFEQEHYLGNLYGNAWYLKDAGEYNFRIYFQPQSLFVKGLILSVLGFAAALLYSVFAVKFKRKVL